MKDDNENDYREGQNNHRKRQNSHKMTTKRNKTTTKLQKGHKETHEGETQRYPEAGGSTSLTCCTGEKVGVTDVHFLGFLML